MEHVAVNSPFQGASGKHRRPQTRLVAGPGSCLGSLAEHHDSPVWGRQRLRPQTLGVSSGHLVTGSSRTSTRRKDLRPGTPAVPPPLPAVLNSCSCHTKLPQTRCHKTTRGRECEIEGSAGLGSLQGRLSFWFFGFWWLHVLLGSWLYPLISASPFTWLLFSGLCLLFAS